MYKIIKMLKNTYTYIYIIIMSRILDNYIDLTKICIFYKQSCPYCIRAIQLIKTKYNIPCKIIDIGKIPNGILISQALENITGQRTVPNIFIFGKHIGGFSQLETLEVSGELKYLLMNSSNPSPRYQCKYCGILYDSPENSCKCFPRFFDDWGSPL